MSPYDRVLNLFSCFNALQKAQALLTWDQQVLMPPGGDRARAAHVAALGRLAHEVLVSDEMGRALEDAERAVVPGTLEAASLRAVRREIEVRRALPAELVERKSRVSSDAYLAWRQARATSEFALLRPYLEELFDIARETSRLRAVGNHPYDGLHDLFEEGATAAGTRAMFDALRGPIKTLIAECQSRPKPESRFLWGDWDAETLRSWAEATAAKIGFDFKRGRLDVASNAFCTNFSCTDVRMTTRHNDRVEGIVFSSLHEMGHGLYEQNSNPAWDRLPLAGGISLGLHESQSRLWENIVGRSLPFWRHFLPSLQAALPALGGVSAEAFYQAINRVEPGPIRIGSDELSYNLHILVRFELECEIVEGTLAVRDLPEAWNAKYETLLGVTPANDGVGCLQDVHWSRGSVGYFPTYTMGNLISWQIWETLVTELGDVGEQMERGDFSQILGWLRERIYVHGKRYRPAELVERVTGSPMRADAYLRGMAAKYAG